METRSASRGESGSQKMASWLVVVCIGDQGELPTLKTRGISSKQFPILEAVGRWDCRQGRCAKYHSLLSNI